MTRSIWQPWTDAQLVCSPSTEQLEAHSSALFHADCAGELPDETEPVEGLQMSCERYHRPVMVDEVVKIFSSVPPGLVVDATVGSGGHSQALLASLPYIRILGLDLDEDALGVASIRLYEAGFWGRVALRHIGFDRLVEISSHLSPHGLSGVLFDLGVSSMQLDSPLRGFSYQRSGPIDMRMDRSRNSVTAERIVNAADPAYLAKIFAESGERRFAWRIAKAIERTRPLHTTKELADVVRSAIPAAARRTGGHPAKRVFQALRIAVNNELEVLSVALPQAIELLVPGGRCVVISYHSGEDRIVKHQFRLAAGGGCSCPPGLPCTCQSNVTARLVFPKSLPPSPQEVADNPRAGSARLRALEKVAVSGGSPSTHTLPSSLTPSPWGGKKVLGVGISSSGSYRSPTASRRYR